MIITVGSKNPNKQDAVKLAFSEFTRFNGATFLSMSADSEVSDQPIGYGQTITGADNRAKNCFSDTTLSVGLESGLIPVTGTRTGYMNLTICTIFDGNTCYHGTGPGFELPADITRMVVNDKLELDDAVKASGLSDNPRIGYSQGIIGLMSNNRVTRKDYMVPAVLMALISLVHDAA